VHCTWGSRDKAVDPVANDATASRATRASLSHELDELDHLVAEGLSES